MIYCYVTFVNDTLDSGVTGFTQNLLYYYIQTSFFVIYKHIYMKFPFVSCCSFAAAAGVTFSGFFFHCHDLMLHNCFKKNKALSRFLYISKSYFNEFELFYATQKACVW